MGFTSGRAASGIKANAKNVLKRLVGRDTVKIQKETGIEPIKLT
jgi:hypothetical protein